MLPSTPPNPVSAAANTSAPSSPRSARRRGLESERNAQIVSVPSTTSHMLSGSSVII